MMNEMSEDDIICEDSYGQACAFCGIEDGSCDCVKDPEAHADLRQKLAAAKEAIKTLQNYADATFDLWDKDHDSKVGKRLRAMAGWLPGYDAKVDAALSQAAKEKV